MRNYFVAVQVEKDGKYSAYVQKVSKSDNLVSKFNHSEGLWFANICESKKEAERIVKSWNEGHKENNRYMFDYPLF